MRPSSRRCQYRPGRPSKICWSISRLARLISAVAITIANLRVTDTRFGEVGTDYEIIREHVDIPLVGLYSACSKNEEKHDELIGSRPVKAGGADPSWVNGLGNRSTPRHSSSLESPAAFGMLRKRTVIR